MHGHDVGAGVDQAPAHLDSLVGRDATGDAEDDGAAGQHRPAEGLGGLAVVGSSRRSSTGMATILSAAISSNAIDSGLRATEVTCGGTLEPSPSPS